jgi:GNAT superfamily N-acetyltransferase
MKKVRDSAFDQPQSPIFRRLTKGRRHHEDVGRYPPRLCRLECWTVRAEVNGVLVGYAWAYDLDGEGRDAYIDDVAVHAAHQNQRVGTALIGELTSWLRECGFRQITGKPIDDRMAQIFDHYGISAGLSSGE